MSRDAACRVSAGSGKADRWRRRRKAVSTPPSVNLTRTTKIKEGWALGPIPLCLSNKASRLRACGRGQRLGRLRLVLVLGLILRLGFLFRSSDFDSALQDRPFFHAEAMGNHIPRQRTLATDIQTIGALHVAVDFAHDDQLLGMDIGRHMSVAADGNAALWEADGPFHPAVDEKCFGAAHFTFDYERASDGGLLHGWSSRLDWNVAIRGGRWRILRFRRLQHV